MSPRQPPIPVVDQRSPSGGYLGFAPPRPRDPTSAVFAALSDPTRRALIRTLAAETDVTATRLAEEFPMSRQAIVKHLAALSDAGLVSTEKVGREQRYRLEPTALEPALLWIAEVGAAWDERLVALKRLLDRPDQDRPDQDRPAP